MLASKLGSLGAGVIDWERVRNLREEVGDESFRDVVAVFLDEVEQVIVQFRTGLAAEQIESALHFLKGGAMILGFAELGTKCDEGERLASAGRSAEVDLPSIVQLYEASRQEFVSALDAKLAA